MRQERLGVLVVAEFGAQTLNKTIFSIMTLNISDTHLNNYPCVLCIVMLNVVR